MDNRVPPDSVYISDEMIGERVTGAYSYRRIGEEVPLYGEKGMPSPDDVKQSTIGNCYFLAALKSLARRNPEYIIKDMIKEEDGRVKVRFYSHNALAPSMFEENWISVDRSVINNPHSRHTEPWVLLLEKAYMTHRLRDPQLLVQKVGEEALRLMEKPIEQLAQQLLNGTLNKEKLMQDWEAAHLEPSILLTLDSTMEQTAQELKSMRDYVLKDYYEKMDTIDSPDEAKKLIQQILLPVFKQQVLKDKKYKIQELSYEEILNSGAPNFVYEALLGCKSADAGIPRTPFLMQQLLAETTPHEIFCATTKDEGDFKKTQKNIRHLNSQLVANHAYEIIEITNKDNEFYIKLANPWNSDMSAFNLFQLFKPKISSEQGIFEIRLADFMQVFTNIYHTDHKAALETTLEISSSHESIMKIMEKDLKTHPKDSENHRHILERMKEIRETDEVCAKNIAHLESFNLDKEALPASRLQAK